MASKVVKKKHIKKSVKISLLIIIILIVVGVILFFGFKKYLDSINNSTPVTVVDEVKKDNISYSLKSNATELFKKEFSKLKDILNSEEVNKEEYAKEVAKLFVIDFYTLSNKISNHDIGGMQFVYSPIKNNMILKAENTLYKYVENNLDGKRKQSLPEVIKIKDDISIKETEVEYNKEKINGYKVTLSWEYKNGEGYQNKTTIRLIEEDGKPVVFKIEE